jgi:hypothetical protein
MIHHCAICDVPLALIRAHNLWSVHKACPRCHRVYSCWGRAAFVCETPAVYVPLPLVFLEAIPRTRVPMIPGPQCRGLL